MFKDIMRFKNIFFFMTLILMFGYVQCVFAMDLTENIDKACKKNKAEHASNLKPKVDSVSAKRNQKNASLHAACVCGKIDLVQDLIKNGADVNCKDGDCFFTPLHCAVLKHHVHIVRYLLDEGADPNAKTKDGLTAHDFACRQNNALIIASLKAKADSVDVKQNKKNEALCKACELGGIDTVRSLIEDGANVSCKDGDHDFTPLHCAVKNCHGDLARYLLSVGADPDVQTKDGLTALDLVYQQENPDLVMIELFSNDSSDSSENAG